LDGRDDRDLGFVMPELGRLLEERGIVFVAFNDERRAPERRGMLAQEVEALRPGALRRAREPEALGEVFGEAADQEPGITASGVEQKGCKRAGGGLSVRACD